MDDSRHSPSCTLPLAMARIATSCATWFRMSSNVRRGVVGTVMIELLVGGLSLASSRRTSAPRLLKLSLRYVDMIRVG